MTNPIHGTTDWECDLPKKQYSIERVMRPAFRTSFDGQTSYHKTRASAIKALAWLIYWHSIKYEVAPGYYYDGEFVLKPCYGSNEPEDVTSADRRRSVNGIAMYQLGLKKLIYPPNLYCAECGTPYYYDECSRDGVEHHPDSEKCRHACSCGEDLR